MITPTGIVMLKSGLGSGKTGSGRTMHTIDILLQPWMIRAVLSDTTLFFEDTLDNLKNVTNFTETAG